MEILFSSEEHSPVQSHELLKSHAHRSGYYSRKDCNKQQRYRNSLGFEGNSPGIIKPPLNEEDVEPSHTDLCSSKGGTSTAVNTLMLVLILQVRWSEIGICPLTGKAPSPGTGFSACKLIPQTLLSWRLVIKLFVRLETGKQTRLSNPFTLSCSRATSTASALRKVAKAGAPFARTANLQGLSRSLHSLAGTGCLVITLHVLM